jgi:hypothetical protein
MFLYKKECASVYTEGQGTLNLQFAELTVLSLALVLCFRFLERKFRRVPRSTLTHLVR